jgi:ATP-dependent exoDNAse (exonuclease V) alpha subunit
VRRRGSGKSASLAAARQAWEAAGVGVRGVAPSAVAAGVLGEQAGIRSDTLAKFLLDAANGRLHLGRGEVIVCDEAAMVSSRDLARLVLLAETVDAKVLLVGDHYQLGSVQAGGMFRLLAADTRTAELTGVRRFSVGGRRHPPATLWRYERDRRIHRPGPGLFRRARPGSRRRPPGLARRNQGRSVVVMAADRDTVERLALRARAARVAAGQVEPHGIAVGGQTIGVGDEIVTTRNDRRLVTTTGAWVRNGDRWHIRHRHPDGTLQLASLQRRGTVTLPGVYAQQHVALAYAVIVHKGQGLTVDQGIVVVDQATSAEHLYVGMTRGRHHNLACVITEPAGDEHQHRQPPTPSQVLAAALQRTSNEKSATETLREELDHLGKAPPQAPAAGILESLRQARQHSYHQTLRRQAQRHTHPLPAANPTPTVSIDGPDL